jgi:tetratricopeptide (TPR) repeat protein
MPLVLVVASSSGGYAQSYCDLEPDEFQLRIGKIDSMIAGGSLTEAAGQTQNLLQLHPDCPLHTWQIEQRLGLALHLLGYSAEALPYLENAVRQAPYEAANHLDLAAALMALQRKGRALSEYEQAVRLAPDNWRALLDYGQALLLFGLRESALQQLLQAEQLCQQCLESARALARHHLSGQDYQAALPHLRCIWLQNPSPEIRQNLALAYLKSGHPDSVSRLLSPLWQDGLTATERLLVLEADKALADPQRAQALSDSLAAGAPTEPDPVLWALVAAICLDAGLDAHALAAIDRAIFLAPENAAYRNNRVVALTRLGRSVEAAEEWERVLKLSPELDANRR